MRVTIGGFKSVEVSPIDVVRMVASSLGLRDLDLDPGPDKVILKAGGRSFIGKDMDAACIKFLESIIK
jgi:hypothetical protein